jgi:hypothetical protein
MLKIKMSGRTDVDEYFPLNENICEKCYTFSTVFGTTPLIR